MRLSIVLFLLASAPFAGAQTSDSKRTPKKPVTVEKYERPDATKVGEEFTFSAMLKNNQGKLALVSARLHLTGNVELLTPDSEQTAFLEADAARRVSWRLKRTGDGKITFYVGTTLLADKRVGGAPVPEATRAMLEKAWQGTFTQPGAIFEAKMTLRLAADGVAEGRILWTVTKSDRADYKDKIGRSGTEFVWGTYDATTRELVIEGYRRDDPYVILGLDQYKLSLGQNHKTLGGKTRTDGTWEGRLDLTPLD